MTDQFLITSIFYAIAERAGYVTIRPRSSSPLGLFSKYDGNIVGGALLGAGMALSGSCPGTLFPQLAAGVRTGLHALDGALLGGILWSGFGSELVKGSREKAGAKAETVSVNEQLGLSKGATLLLLEVVLLTIVATTIMYTPEQPNVKLVGAAGGLLIGIAQLVSLISRRSMIGISGSYEEIGNFFWWLVKGADSNTRPTSYQSILFASGVAAGATALAKGYPSLVAGPVFEVSPALATIGGVLMVVGSRMAGGCTSGHGISGVSLLSTSSMVTIASTFAAGMVVVQLAH